LHLHLGLEPICMNAFDNVLTKELRNLDFFPLVICSRVVVVVNIRLCVCLDICTSRSFLSFLRRRFLSLGAK